MKNILKKLGQIPTIYWALSVISVNVIFTMINNIPLIIIGNGVLLVTGLLGIFSRFIK